MSNLLTTLQAATQLNLHPDTSRLWRKLRRGPSFIKLGNRYRYSPEAIEEFLSKEAQ